MVRLDSVGAMSLPASTPRAEGVDAAGIHSFLDTVQAAGVELHSLLIARHGRVIAAGSWAPYDLERLHLGYSLSKSVTATAVATLVDRGELALDTPVLDVLPVDGIDVDPRWRAVQVQHCLSMTVGHTEDAWMPMMRLTTGPGAVMSSYLATTLATGPSAAPGTVFCYNQVATYVLSRIVAHVTGRQLLDVLRERVFDRLGIGEVLWHRCPEGFELGFSGCHLRPVDLMSLTQLWLDRGQRDGEAIVSPAWFDRAARPFLPMAPNEVSDWEQGYGFSYWKSRHGHRADGAFGQYGVILPEHDVAIAVNGELEDMQVLLDIAWAHLLPAFDRPGSADADDTLAARLVAVAIPPLADDSSGPARISVDLVAPSDLPETYSRLDVERTGAGFDLTFSVDGADVTIPAAIGSWADGTLTVDRGALPTSATAGWNDGLFRATVRLVETPHTLNVEAQPGSPTSTSAAVSWTLQPLLGPDPRSLAVRSR